MFEDVRSVGVVDDTVSKGDPPAKVTEHEPV
jgi:hypothetical protein